MDAPEQQERCDPGCACSCWRRLSDNTGKRIQLHTCHQTQSFLELHGQHLRCRKESLAVIKLLLRLTQAYQLWNRWRRGALCDGSLHGVVDGVEGLIGNTPLVRIRSLSEQTGCEVRLRHQQCADGKRAAHDMGCHARRHALWEVGKLKPMNSCCECLCTAS